MMKNAVLWVKSIDRDKGMSCADPESTITHQLSCAP